jgi:hypothetical protein
MTEGIDKVEGFVQKLRRNPLKTIALSIVALVVLLTVAFLNGLFGKLGERKGEELLVQGTGTIDSIGIARPKSTYSDTLSSTASKYPAPLPSPFAYSKDVEKLIQANFPIPIFNGKGVLVLEYSSGSTKYSVIIVSIHGEVKQRCTFHGVGDQSTFRYLENNYIITALEIGDSFVRFSLIGERGNTTPSD